MAFDPAGFLDELPAGQRHLAEQLLALDVPRPPADPDQHRRLTELLHDRLAPLVEARPEGARPITLGKTQLDALSCDGRFLDQQAAGFEWSAPTVRGQLVHRAVNLDHQTRRAQPVELLLSHAWEEFRHSGDSALDFCEDVSELEVAAISGDAATVVEEFRAIFPLLPVEWNVVWEPTITVPLVDGSIRVRGKPDLRLGRPDPRSRRMLLADLKTGNRSASDRQDMRWYALLATLKYRQAPFRVATVYLDEGRHDVEDVTEDVLEAAARELATRIGTAIRLADEPEVRTLVAGPYCRWCGLAEDCEEKARADAEWAERTQLP